MTDSRNAGPTTEAKPEIPVTLSMPVDQALAIVELHLQAGRLPAAEAACRDILRARPNFAPVLHLLGVVLYHANNLSSAIDFVRRAIESDSSVALYYCNLCEMCRLAGQRDAALSAGRQALSINPNMPQALNNIGIVCYEREELDEAVAHYRQAIAHKPDYAEAHSNLGNALRAQKKYDEALISYRQALALRPTYAEAMNNMGTALREMGRWAEAEATYRQALALSPASSAVLNNLALALKEREQFDEASALLTRSLLLDPNNAKTLTYLALVRLEQKRIADAESAAGAALALTPEDADALDAMGLVRFEQQNSDEALVLFRRAVALKPDFADVHNNIGNIHKENGQLDMARSFYERAIEIQPRETGYYVNLVDTKKFIEGDAHLAAMEALASGSDALSDTGRCRLKFALAKIYDDLGRYDDAFACMREANTLKRQQINYDETRTFELIDRIRSTFDRNILETKAHNGYRSSLPVFIVGMPRSGTTLVEQILASHPAVYGAGELFDFNRLVSQMSDTDGKTFRYPEATRTLTGSKVRELGKAYVEGLTRKAPNAKRITDKMPANFLFLGLIHMALPEARIIHVQRDPCDTCLSCYSKLFAAEQNFSYDLGELARYYVKYAELMAHWRKVLPEGTMLEIRYEDIIEDVDSSARLIVDHCRLSWSSNCATFYETRRPIRTASASQVRRPIYGTSRGRWRAYQSHLGELVSALEKVLSD